MNVLDKLNHLRGRAASGGGDGSHKVKLKIAWDSYSLRRSICDYTRSISVSSTRSLSVRGRTWIGARGQRDSRDGDRVESTRWIAGAAIQVFDKHGLMEKFISQHWPFGATPAGESRRRACVRIADEYDQFLAAEDTDEETEQSGDVLSFQFALEAHLRDFLAKNLNQIEPGLKLCDIGGKSGIEFPVEGGRIDILAVDRDGAFVAIELKLSQGRNKALGQLLYYMGWIDQYLGSGRCRGVVIANEISEELAIAVSRAPGVELFRYKMNFSLEPAR